MLTHGTQARAIFILAGVASLDAFVPVLPAEVFAIGLAILQPSRSRLIVFLFAASAACSAFLLALVLGYFSEAVGWLGLQVLGVQWEHAVAIVREWGAGTLVLTSVFPDCPRTSIAVLAFSGIDPIWIACMVFVGKLVLYVSLFVLMSYLPKHWGRRRPEQVRWRKWLQNRSLRFLAYRRHLRRLAAIHQQGVHS